jgi:IS4 transposase
MASRKLPDLALEMKTADFGDIRLSQRLGLIVDAILEAPELGFPDIFDEDAELEALYRFFRNKRVDADSILEPHYVATKARVQAVKNDVIVVHDTTECRFGGESERDGLGVLGRQKGQGFYAHVALAVSADDVRRPYGVLGLKTIVREGHRGRRTEEDRRDPARESLRWGELVSVVEKRLPKDCRAIHVMDREADIYDVMQQIAATNGRFVIRSKHDRYLIDEDGQVAEERLFSRLTREIPLSQREAKLSPRKLKRPNSKGALPARDARSAVLNVKATRVRLRAPKRAKSEGPDENPWLDVNVVLVTEPEPPDGEAPIVWQLLTTEPVATERDVARVIDAYRGRWVIEELFKALKTGCAYEKRQLESLSALVNALATLLPVAWHLLLMRTMAREKPTAPASVAFSRVQLAIMRRTKRAKLPPKPTVYDALMALARMGGYLKAKGRQPGWQILGRAYRKLTLLEEGWLLAGGAM